MKISELFESSNLPELPQEVVGKSNSIIAKALEPHLKAVGIKLDKMNPFPEKKGCIWSVKSDKLEDGQVACLNFNARARGGRGQNKDRNLSLSFAVVDADGKRVEFRRPGGGAIDFVAAITYKGAGDIYKDCLA